MQSGLLGYLVVLGVTIGGVVLFAVSMLARRLLAPRVSTPTKTTTYESGVDPIAGGWQQTAFRYVGFAFLYVVFAVDAVYLFPWALVLRDHHLGLASAIEVGLFVLVVLLGLAHAARRGALTWS